MTTPVEQLTFTPTSATVGRSLANWTGDVINVKNCGAIGNGVADDTAAIQSAFDAAFGSVTSPHGTYTGPGTTDLNKPVFFPNGIYSVVAPANLTVSGAADNGAGLIRLTVNSTVGWTTNWIAYVSGITGTISAFANGVFGIVVVDGTHIDLRGTLGFAGTYSAGGTVKTSALHIAGVMGGYIYGAGKEVSQVICTNGTVISLNGFGYGKIERLTFSAPAGADASFDLNWDGVTVQSTQSNMIQDCTFGGACNYGLMIGFGGSQCSENVLIDNKIGGCVTAGIAVSNFNALGNTAIGGNISSCGIGISVIAGSMEVIHGVHFQANTQDIEIDNTVGTAYSIAGCRTESANFILNHRAGMSVTSCNQRSSSVGVFLYQEQSGGLNQIGTASIDNCHSDVGTITGDGIVNVRGSQFSSSSVFGSFTGKVGEYVVGPVTIAALLAASTPLKGLRQSVTDAVGPITFGSTVLGSSSTLAPVYCDGTTWRYG